MAGENECEMEPQWVRRLKERGHQVEGGEGDFPEEPRVAFEPMRPRQRATGLRNVLAWIRERRRGLSTGRRHAPVP